MFVRILSRCKIALVAIDEAHCIAQWGHDFRPDYLRIGALLERLRPPRILACTATATPEVRREIKERLGLGGEDAPCKEVLRGFARPNLHLAARNVDGPKQASARRCSTALDGRARRAAHADGRRDRLRGDAQDDRAVRATCSRSTAGTRPRITRG